MKQYEARGWMKFAEKDNIELERDPDTTVHAQGSDVFSGPTMDAVIDAAKKMFDIGSNENVMINSCEEPGRVDLQVLETDEGIRANKGQILNWKKGGPNRWLWAATYTIKIELVERSEVIIEKGQRDYSTD